MLDVPRLVVDVAAANFEVLGLSRIHFLEKTGWIQISKVFRAIETKYFKSQ